MQEVKAAIYAFLDNSTSLHSIHSTSVGKPKNFPLSDINSSYYSCIRREKLFGSKAHINLHQAHQERPSVRRCLNLEDFMTACAKAKSLKHPW